MRILRSIRESHPSSLLPILLGALVAISMVTCASQRSAGGSSSGTEAQSASTADTFALTEEPLREEPHEIPDPPTGSLREASTDGAESTGINTASDNSHENIALLVAVSPFLNVGLEAADDYIGFQVGEFLATAMASFEGILVVERRQLHSLLEEQELQLSGLTDSATTVRLGNLLNAQQVVVGSYSLSSVALTLSGRIVEVESGAVLSSATIETPRADSYLPAYRAFLFELISNLPDYRVTIPVEARLQMIDQQVRDASEDYARALEALYRQDDEAALEHLERSIGGTDVDYVRFPEMASEYTEILRRVEGSSIYIRMMENHISHNQQLTEHLDPLAQYRATLTVLRDRVCELLTPDEFHIDAHIPSEEEWPVDSVSVIVPPPSAVHVSLSEEAVKAIESIFSQQSVLQLSQQGFERQPAPSGALLSDRTLQSMFEISWQATMGYGVQFVNVAGEVLFEVESQPSPIFELSSTKRQTSFDMPIVFREVTPRDGWQLQEDGAVRIQSRVLRDLAAVRVVPKRNSFSIQSSFGLSSDVHWQSLISHVYRMKSVKVPVTDDPAPAIKNVVVTDSWMYTGNPEIDPVPIVPRHAALAGFLELTGVVYLADQACGSVSGAWSGAVTGNRQHVTGEFDANSVLFFTDPRRDAFSSGSGSFEAAFGDSQLSVDFRLELGGSWMISGASDMEGIAVDDRQAYVTGPSGTSAIGKMTGSSSWSTPIPGDSVAVHEAHVYVSGLDRTAAIEAETGREVWRTPDTWEHDFVADNDTVVADGRGVYVLSLDRTMALDAMTGGELWRMDHVWGFTRSPSQDVGDAMVLNGAQLYVSRSLSNNTTALETTTGRILWREYTRASSDIAVAEDRAFVAGSTTVAIETASGRVLWRANNTRGAAVAADGDRVYVWSLSGEIHALDASTGHEIWRTEVPNNIIVADGGCLYVSGNGDQDHVYALDSSTGNVLWRASRSAGSLVIDNGFLYGSKGVRFDLSLVPAFTQSVVTTNNR